MYSNYFELENSEIGLIDVKTKRIYQPVEQICLKWV